MGIGTDLTSISTHGWYTDPVLTDTLTPISTFGWYYEDAGIISVLFNYKIPIENVSLLEKINNIPIEFISTFASQDDSKILIENVSSLLDAGNIPVEKLAGIDTDNNILTEILGGVRRAEKIPVETIGNLNLVVSTQIPIDNIALLFQQAGIPVEILTDTVLITGEKQIPIEHLAGILSDNQIPVEVFREIDGSIWALDRRGVLWEVDSRQVLWDITNCGVLWIRKD